MEKMITKEVESTALRKQWLMKKLFVSNGIKKFAFLIAVIFIFTSGSIVLADLNPPSPSAVNITLINPLGSANSDIGSVLQNIMQWLIMAGSPIAAFMVIVGGIQILVSGGEPAKFEKGKKTILYTAVGYGIILVGSGIISIVQKILSG